MRPLLAATRAEIEAYLRGLGQDWREDSLESPSDLYAQPHPPRAAAAARGLEPAAARALAQMAELARDEEAWWQAELARLAPQLILPGRPVRGGGRAAGAGRAVWPSKSTRLAALARRLQRRLLRHAAEQLGAALDFAATEAVRALALAGRAGQKLALPQGLRAERTGPRTAAVAG